MLTSAFWRLAGGFPRNLVLRGIPVATFFVLVAWIVDRSAPMAGWVPWAGLAVVVALARTLIDLWKSRRASPD